MTNKSKLKAMALLSCGIMAVGAACGEASCLTATPQADGQLLYFTSTSLLADDQHLVFLSDRTGQPNIFVRDLTLGRDRQLTTNKEGFLKSYVYFDGLPYRGLGKASVSVDPQRGVVYYIQGRQIRAVNTNGVERVLAMEQQLNAMAEQMQRLQTELLEAAAEMRREVDRVERSHRFELVPVSHTQIVPLGRRRRRA